MQSTMQDVPLTVTDIFQRGRRMYPDSEVVTFGGQASRRARFPDVAERSAKLASGLRRLGVAPGDRVATLCWNNQEHVEAYFAIPCLGAVLHTLNLRLHPRELSFIINHAADRIIIVDSSLVPLLESIRADLTTLETVIIIGDAAGGSLGEVVRYEDLIDTSTELTDWPEIDEKQAAAMCYTTGTTGNPKGVVYSHRSIWLHSLGFWANFAIRERDRILTIVPMFHANAWGLPFTAWMVGADLHLPDRFLQPDPLLTFIAQEKPTFAGGVPTVFQGLLLAAEAAGADLSSIRIGICGGSAVPTSLMQAYQARHVTIVQGWGMTETSPLAAVAVPPGGVTEADADFWHYRSKSGRVSVGVELRVMGEDGSVLPWDGEAVGEIEVRGSWVTGAYYGVDAAERFDEGWLRTGDVGTVDARGFVQVTDRAKDVIKSGGEWISSVEIENLLMGHPAVIDAAVVGIPDEKWSERPLALVTFRPGRAAAVEELRQFLSERVARFWLPESWAIVAEIPKTSVGKQDKKRIRALYAEGSLPVSTLQTAAR